MACFAAYRMWLLRPCRLLRTYARLRIMTALEAAWRFGGGGAVVMEMVVRYRGYIILTLIYIIVFGVYFAYERRPQLEPIEIIEPTMGVLPTEVPIQVHVAGAVRDPGVYSLPANSRLLQAIDAAGGMTADADQESVNLADFVRDGQRAYIPKIGTPSPPAPTAIGVSKAGAGTGKSIGGLVNINTATSRELEALPGIGQTYAARIIAYRESQGAFTEPAQIMQVKGIGKVCYERIKTCITVQ